jgi:murein L,D-transpeptidase YafK
VSYPNASDRVLGRRGSLGGDIYVHGSCVTIGCLPIEDDNIQELYWLAIEARAAGGRLPIHIFPARLDEAGWARLRQEFDGARDLVDFWATLRPAFDHFERSHRLPRFTVDARGRYQVAAR